MYFIACFKAAAAQRDYCELSMESLIMKLLYKIINPAQNVTSYIFKESILLRNLKILQAHIVLYAIIKSSKVCMYVH